MRTRVLTTLLLLCLCPLPLFAAGEGFYLGVWGGGTLLDEAKVRDARGTAHVDFDAGTAFGAALGYDIGTRYPAIGQGRLELEIAHRQNDLKDAKFSDGRLAADGEISVLSFMANSFAEFYGARPWLPYVGLGLGYARVSLDSARLAGAPWGDDSDGVFAYQAGLGVGYELNQLLTLDLGYRYFGTLDATFRLADQTSVDWEYDNHALLLGLRLTFR